MITGSSVAGPDVRSHSDSKRESEPTQRPVTRPQRDFPLSVDEIMSRNVRFCRPEDSLATAAIAMCEADCRFLPVVDEAGRPVGVVTDGDIILLGARSHRCLNDMFVRDAMSGPPVTCHAEDSVLNALRLMQGQHIRHLPVVNPLRLLEGVVSLTDIVLGVEEKGSPGLQREVSAALREHVRKHGSHRVIEHNLLAAN